MALADALHSLLRLPGATYSCVVERDSGRVLAEVGQGEAASGDSEGVVAYSVPRWGTAVAAMFDSTSGDELDDVMITGRRSYHLVRPIGPGASVLVYLRLDRRRSNLAAARRELGTVRLAGGAATPPAAPGATAPTASGTTAAPPTAAARKARSDGDTAGPAARSRTGLAATAPRSHTDDAAAAAQSRGDPAARNVGRTVAATSAAPPPPQVPAALTPPSTPVRGVRRPPAEAPSGPASPGAAGPGGSAASPRSADPARQIPLPRRAPSRSATDAGPTRQRPEARSSALAAAEPVPEGFAMPAVLGQSWARDPNTLRRLIAGLRRMTS